MLVCYDLQTRVPTYDFFIWLVHAKLLGATAVVIARGNKLCMRHKWLPDETEQRLKNYILPGPPLLAGIPCTMGERRAVARLEPIIRANGFYTTLLADVVRLGKPLPLLTLKQLAFDRPFCTVTLRQTSYKPERNSDEAVWRSFATKIGALVIEDHVVKPLSLEERMSIYASAAMNYGVPNGPMGLLEITPYPVTIFSDPEVNPITSHYEQGLTEAGQRPWALPNQAIVWTKPTLEVLLGYHKEHGYVSGC